MDTFNSLEYDQQLIQAKLGIDLMTPSQKSMPIPKEVQRVLSGGGGMSGFVPTSMPYQTGTQYPTYRTEYDAQPVPQAMARRNAATQAIGATQAGFTAPSPAPSPADAKPDNHMVLTINAETVFLILAFIVYTICVAIFASVIKSTMELLTEIRLAKNANQGIGVATTPVV